MSEWTLNQIKNGLKEAFDEQKRQGNYKFVPASADASGRQLYRPVVQPSAATKYWDAQLSAYYFSIGR